MKRLAFLVVTTLAIFSATVVAEATEMQPSLNMD